MGPFPPPVPASCSSSKPLRHEPMHDHHTWYLVAAQVACGGDRTLAVCQHEVRDAEARGAADRRLLGSWCAVATCPSSLAPLQLRRSPASKPLTLMPLMQLSVALHGHGLLVHCRSKRWEALTVDVSQGSSHESLGGQPSGGLAPLSSAMSLSASAASLGKDPSKGPPGGSSYIGIEYLVRS